MLHALTGDLLLTVICDARLWPFQGMVDILTEGLRGPWIGVILVFCPRKSRVAIAGLIVGPEMARDRVRRFNIILTVACLEGRDVLFEVWLGSGLGKCFVGLVLFS